VEEFNEVYRQYFQQVYRFVLTLCRDEKLAEEVTQETFYKAFKSLDQYKGNCQIHVWLSQIAKNTYFSHLRKQKRLDPLDQQERGSELNVEALLQTKEEAFLVHKALHQLDEPYKEVFTLRVFGELSFKQISELFGKTESWARVTFHRAKPKIQRIMEEEIR
jgi:RNA polymerase sigma-70 factor (ECF subfamily)